MKVGGKIWLVIIVIALVAMSWLGKPLIWQGRDWVFSLLGYASSGGENQEDSIATLQVENERLQREQARWQRLQDQLDIPTFESFSAIPGVVVGRPIDTFRAQLIVNQGSRAGVQLGAPVVIRQAILIGFISQVNEQSSIMTLLFHPATDLTAEIVSDDKPFRGLIKGRQYTSLYLTTVPRDVVLTSGQNVVALEEPGRIPYGLLIGSIDQIYRQETGPYQEALLRLPYQPDAVEALVILVPPP